MSNVIVGAGLMVALLAGVAVYQQHRANGALRHEMANLREEVRSATRTVQAAETQRRSAAAAAPALPAAAAGPAAGEDLVKLREEIAALRKSTTALTQFVQMAQAAQALAKTAESIPTKLTPAGDLRNVGKATPEAIAQTTLWAAVAGDVDVLADGLMFNPATKHKADTWFAGLSESTRQQYGSPEKVMALMIARDAASVSGMQILGQKELGPDDVGVRVRVGSNEGKTKDDTFLLHRTTDGWKMMLPDSAVEKFARQLSGGK